MISKAKKTKLISSVQDHKADTGSSEVQIALLTERIAELSAHLKGHAKDNHSRRGLLKMVAKRKKLLSYLQRESEKRYDALVKKLKIKG